MSRLPVLARKSHCDSGTVVSTKHWSTMSLARTFPAVYRRRIPQWLTILARTFPAVYLIVGSGYPYLLLSAGIPSCRCPQVYHLVGIPSCFGRGYSILQMSAGIPSCRCSHGLISADSPSCKYLHVFSLIEACRYSIL